MAGAAASADGGFKAGMGIAVGDLDGDGLIDLAVTNYFGESTTFYRNLGQGFFADHSNSINMAAPTRRLLGFGIAFVDADNDGWLDVLSANGHVLDPRPQIPWTMPLQILQGSPGGRLTDVSEQAGAPFRPLHLGRGLAAGDLDNDGRIDAVVVVQNEPLVYLHNQTDNRGHFITFQLEGTRSNRDGVALGSQFTPPGAGRLPSGTAEEAINPPTIRAFTLGWAQPRVSKRSRFAGRPGRSIAMRDCRLIVSTVCEKERRRRLRSWAAMVNSAVAASVPGSRGRDPSHPKCAFKSNRSW